MTVPVPSSREGHQSTAWSLRPRKVSH
jgi:hypothetical protein